MVSSCAMWSRPADRLLSKLTLSVHHYNISHNSLKKNTDIPQLTVDFIYPAILHHFVPSHAHVDLIRGRQWVSHLLIIVTSVCADRLDEVMPGDSAHGTENSAQHRGCLQGKSSVIEIWMWSRLIKSYQFHECVHAYYGRSLHSSGIGFTTNLSAMISPRNLIYFQSISPGRWSIISMFVRVWKRDKRQRVKCDCRFVLRHWFCPERAMAVR